MSKHLLSLFLVAAYAFQPIQAATLTTQTLYYIASIEIPTPSTIFHLPTHTVQGTTRYSAISTATVTDSSGGVNTKTKYDMEVVLSYWVQEVDGTPQTIISAPWTRTYTLEENASHLAMSAPPSPYTTGFVQNAGVHQECSFDLNAADRKGTCVEVDEIALEPTTASGGSVIGRTLTWTTTYTAGFTPAATFTGTAQSSGAGRGLELELKGGLLGVALVVMVSWFGLL